jgi:ribosomal protein S11
MQETENDAIMTRVDLQGNVLGFSILGVSQLKKDHPLVAELSGNVTA